MRSLSRSLRSWLLHLAGLIGLTGFVHPLLAQLPLEPAALDHHATIVGRRVGIDSIAFHVEQDTTASVSLIVDHQPYTEYEKSRIVPFSTHPATLLLTVVNRGALPLRIPMWIFIDPMVEAVRRGRPLSPWSGVARVSYPSRGPTQARWTTINVAAPRMALWDQTRRIEMPGGTLARLEQGQRSPPLTFGVSYDPDFDEFRIGVTVRALPAAPPVPATAPSLLPGSVLAAAPVVQAEPAPLSFAAGLLSIRFRPDVPHAVRQIVVERLGGRVVGGMGEAGEGAERDYVIALSDSSSADRTLAAVGLAHQWGEAYLLRAGLVFAEPLPQPADQPPLPEMPEPDPQTLLLTIKFAVDATPGEIAAALATVGATPIGFGRDHFGERTRIVRLTDSTEGGYERAISQLRTIAATGISGAWIGARMPIPLCAGWCGPPPPDSGAAPADPAIRAFVDSLRLPGASSIRDIVSLPEFDFLAFTVYYDVRSEVHPRVHGLRHQGRIGLLRPNTWRPPGSAGDPLIALEDTALRSTSLLDTLEQWDINFFVNTYLPALMRSPIANRAVMRRMVARCFGNRVGCELQQAVEIAARDHDIVTLTELGFLPFGGGMNANKPEAPRKALRGLASEILADRAAAPATLFLIALSLVDEPDSVLATRLLVHPVAGQDPAVLTLLSNRHHWVVDILLERLPAVARPVLGPLLVAHLFPDRNVRLRALLADPVLGDDRVMLTVIANLGPWVPRLLTAAAARRLPDEVSRRWDDYPAPPPLPDG